MEKERERGWKDYGGQKFGMRTEMRQGKDRVRGGGRERNLRRYGCMLCDISGSSADITPPHTHIQTHT